MALCSAVTLLNHLTQKVLNQEEPEAKMSIFLVSLFIVRGRKSTSIAFFLSLRQGTNYPVLIGDHFSSVLLSDLQGFSSDLNAVIFFECRRPRAGKEHHLLTLRVLVQYYSTTLCGGRTRHNLWSLEFHLSIHHELLGY